MHGLTNLGRDTRNMSITTQSSNATSARNHSQRSFVSTTTFLPILSLTNASIRAVIKGSSHSTGSMSTSVPFTTNREITVVKFAVLYSPKKAI